MKTCDKKDGTVQEILEGVHVVSLIVFIKSEA
jgi:hypothetical protein